MIRWLFNAVGVVATIQLFSISLAFGATTASGFDPETPFVICHNQRYALCAQADCFVYNGVAYCKCEVKKGNSISLQLSYTSPAGPRDACEVDRQGVRNGYMLSTYSLPNDAKKGGPVAAYTCPGTDDAGTGVPAPVAYGQCDGGMCFTSTRGKRFPGFDIKLKDREVMCSCPISTAATPGSTDPLGYQIFGVYHPNAVPGSRCDASACAKCGVTDPTANGAIIPVGAPTGAADFLTLKLDNQPPPPLNECLCSCTKNQDGSTSCSVAEDTTPQ